MRNKTRKKPTSSVVEVVWIPPHQGNTQACTRRTEKVNLELFWFLKSGWSALTRYCNGSMAGQTLGWNWISKSTIKKHNKQQNCSLNKCLISELTASSPWSFCHIIKIPMIPYCTVTNNSFRLFTSWQLPSCLASAAVWDKPWSWRYRSAGSWRRWGPALSCCRPAVACRLPPASGSQNQACLGCRCSSANARKNDLVSGEQKILTLSRWQWILVV